MVNPWSGAFQGEVTIANTGSTAFNGWTGTLNLGGGATITQMWGGTYSPASGTVTIRPMDYTRNIGPGQIDDGRLHRQRQRLVRRHRLRHLHQPVTPSTPALIEE